MTGRWEAGSDAKTLLDADDAMAGGEEEDSDLDGDFEDLETGEKHVAGEASGDDDGENSGEDTFG